FAIVGGDDAAVTEAAEVFGRIETQAAHRAERAGPLPFKLRANCLAGIFDDWHVAGGPGDGANLVHSGTLTEQVDRHDRLRSSAQFAEHLAGIEIEGLGVDINEHWRRAEPPYGAGSGEEREAGQYHFVPRSDAEHHQ